MTTMLDKAQTAIASYCAPLGISTIREERLAIARAALQAIRDEFSKPLAYEHHGVRTAVGMTAFRCIRQLDQQHGKLSGGFRDHDDLTAADAIIPAMLTAILEEKPE